VRIEKLKSLEIISHKEINRWWPYA